jgi:formamidopyrimidine-DNA glycosylase
MPELPEVETTLRGIAPLVVGRRVAIMHVYDRRLRWSVPRWLPARIAGRTVDAVDRRSKYLLFRCSGDTLLVHFGMTGSLRAFVHPPPRRLHDHVDIVLDSGVTLRYHDPRRFGAMLWLPRPRGTPAASAGPEPRPACADYLWRATRRRSRRSNWYMTTILSSALATSTPTSRSADSSDRLANSPAARLARLLEAVRATLTEAIAKGGSTLRDYVDSRGERGCFQLDSAVYGRKGLPCRMHAAVCEIRQGGRTTSYCPLPTMNFAQWRCSRVRFVRRNRPQDTTPVGSQPMAQLVNSRALTPRPLAQSRCDGIGEDAWLRNRISPTRRSI